MKKPNVWLALVGGVSLALLLSAPLLALLYLANLTVGVPFIPYDVFDLVSRTLPGSVITTGIDSMVGLLTTLGLSVRENAKLAEQLMAVGLTVILAMIGGAVYFAVYRGRRSGWGAGLGYGLVLGVILGAISATRQGATLIDGLWTLLALLVWGLGLAWLQRRTVRVVTPAAVAEPLNRRQFIVRVGSAAALITVAGAGVGAALGRRTSEAAAEAPAGQRWSANNPLPNAGTAVAAVQGTRPEYTPLEQYYRIDINLAPPVVQEADWRLRVEGLVNTPKEYTLQELRAYDAKDQFITMSCISNPVGGELISTTRWTGVPLQKLLPEWGLEDNATHLRISSADGFFEYVALDDVRNDERITLNYAWDGVPLQIQHGFPLRIFIPDHYGMKQPKWIETVEAVDAWAPGYWVVRSWDREARVKETSVIDTVATNMMIAGAASSNEKIPVGGIAYAGARGVSKVELQVDGGDWQKAELRKPVSDLTWVLWRFEWPFSSGEHTFTVRCTDKNGDQQITEQQPPHPSGASGLDNRQAMV